MTNLFQRSWSIHWLLAFVLIGTLLSLAACGNLSQTQTTTQTVPAATKSPLPTAGTASTTPSSKSTPQATPTAQGAMTAQVKIVLSKAQYTMGETLIVTILNSLSTPIFISPYHTDCTPILLEKVRITTWMPLNPCRNVQSRPFVHVEPGSTLAYQLTTSTRVTGTSSSWQPGIYRASISYVLVPDPDMVQGGTLVYSEKFTLKSP